MSGERYVLGIDLGTTNSCAAVYRNERVEIIPNTEGCNITPSVVAFTSGRRHVGNEAKDQLAWNAENTVYGAKRLLGRTFDDPHLQKDMRMWPFTVVSVNEKPKIQVTDQGSQKTFHPEEISALVLSRIKEVAEAYLCCKVTDAVITVPAYFDNNQRQATRAAGRIAGLNVLRLINEPTAAAIAYGLDKKIHHNVLVYDLGGGTFDVSILKIDNGSFEVKATKGDTHLGGEDFDNRMVEHFAKEIKDQYNKDIFENKRAVRRLKNACEKAKVRLSSSNRVLLEDLPNLLPGVDFEPSIFRYQFEEMNLDLFKRTIDTVEEALNDAKMFRGDIQDVVLVGGSTRILKVQTLLKNFFRRDRLNRNINPDEAVAYGAAVQGAILSGNRPGNLEGIELYDVVPLSLGTDVIGARMSVIIPRNTPIPTRKRSTYNTTRDNQTSMLVQVYEGEREFLKDNSYLGETVLTGIQPDPRGYATVDVIFEIDDDCILHVKARDRDTNREENLQIYNNAKKLSEAQMQRLIQEAEGNKLVDMIESLKITALNELEFYMSDVRSHCNSPAFELTSSQRTLVLSKLDEARDWINRNDHKLLRESDFKAKQKELEDIWNPIITFSINMKVSGKTGRSSGKPILLGD